MTSIKCQQVQLCHGEFYEGLKVKIGNYAMDSIILEPVVDSQ